MTFFDKKEDVIQIELTQYGKYLLSKGKLKPVYYAFFDDNILYDIRYGDIIGETQNSVEDRIQVDTPQTSVQHVYSGIETEFKKAMKLIRTGKAKVGDDKILPTAEKNFALGAPLGNSKLASDKSPAWNIRALAGKFENVNYYTTGSQPTTRVPQIDVTVEYEIGIERGDPKRFYLDRGASDVEYFEDGTQIRVWEDRLLLDVGEENVPLTRENYDIEVFLVEEEDVSGSISTPGISNPTKRDILTPLYFVPENGDIRGNILRDSSDPSGLAALSRESDASFVEYFLDLEADQSIDHVVLQTADAGSVVRPTVDDGGGEGE
jgi:hypothetical protein